MEGDPIGVKLAIGIGEETAKRLLQLGRTAVQRTQEHATEDKTGENGNHQIFQ